jgi:hypothetical protein
VVGWVDPREAVAPMTLAAVLHPRQAIHPAKARAPRKEAPNHPLILPRQIPVPPKAAMSLPMKAAVHDLDDPVVLPRCSLGIRAMVALDVDAYADPRAVSQAFSQAFEAAAALMMNPVTLHPQAMRLDKALAPPREAPIRRRVILLQLVPALGKAAPIRRRVILLQLVPALGKAAPSHRRMILLQLVTALQKAAQVPQRQRLWVMTLRVRAPALDLQQEALGQQAARPQQEQQPAVQWPVVPCLEALRLAALRTQAR